MRQSTRGSVFHTEPVPSASSTTAASAMEGRLSAVTLVCLALSGVAAINVNIPQATFEAARGDDVTLPCTFQTNVQNPNFTIAWSVREPDGNAAALRIITYYSRDGYFDIKKAYEGRVSLDTDVAKRTANLKLTSITLADNKIFQCRVTVRGDDEGKPVASTRLVVLVAPSTPICEIQGKAEYGQNINLTCKSEEGSPEPTYKWESRDVKNTPRAPSPRTTDKNGVLSLFNISRDTSGFYICTSANKIRSASCNLTLAVMPPSMNIGSTAGIIGGVVAALIVLIVVIYCCCCRKKKKQQDEYTMGVRENEYHDKEPGRNGGQVERQEDRDNYDDSSARNASDRYEERREGDRDDPRRDYDDPPRDRDDPRRDRDDPRRDRDDPRRDRDDPRRDRDDPRRDRDDPRRDRDDPRRDRDDPRRDRDDHRMEDRPRSDYDDPHRDYDERRSDYSPRHERRDDHDRYEDRYDDRRDRRHDDRYDEPYDDRERDRPRRDDDY